MLFLLRENVLDELRLEDVRPFVMQYVSYVQSIYAGLYKEMFTTGDITEQQQEQLRNIAKEFKNLFVPA